MLLFIALSLGLCFVNRSPNALQTLLASPIFMYAGLVVALTSVAGLLLKKLSERIAYEAFLCGSLFVWFAYWKPLFNPQSPIFFFYALYFALMTAGVFLFLNNQRSKLDKQTLRYTQRFDEERLFPPWLLMLFILGSLELRQHYQLFPVLITLLVLRFAFSASLARNL